MSTTVTLHTPHQDVIHDSQFDYYGRYLATCSSDRTIHIFAITPAHERNAAACSSDGSSQQQQAAAAAMGSKNVEAVLTGHDGPVWMVAWAHPQFGTVLASASYDQRVIVWKRSQQQQQGHPSQQQQQQQQRQGEAIWKPAHIISSHQASVNALAFSSPQFGLQLATASSDGTVGVTRCEGGSTGGSSGPGWRETSKVASVSHPMGCMGVCWAPYDASSQPNTAAAAYNGLNILASCGCDAHAKVYVKKAADSSSSNSNSVWALAADFAEHTDWVRDVAFCPDETSSHVVVATCAQDKKLIIRRIQKSKFLELLPKSATSGNAEEGDDPFGEEPKEGEQLDLSSSAAEIEGKRAIENAAQWEASVSTFASPLWRVSWSPCGTQLLVTTGDSQVFVLKQGANFSDEWIRAPVEK